MERTPSYAYLPTTCRQTLSSMKTENRQNFLLYVQSPPVRIQQKENQRVNNLAAIALKVTANNKYIRTVMDNLLQ